MRFAMLGFRQCERCQRMLPEEFFRNDNSHCRICQREKDEAEQRAAPTFRIAGDIVARPRERWAKDLISRLQRNA